MTKSNFSIFYQPGQGDDYVIDKYANLFDRSDALINHTVVNHHSLFMNINYKVENRFV